MANASVPEDCRKYGVIFYNLITNVGGKICRSILRKEVGKTKEATLSIYLAKRKGRNEQYHKVYKLHDQQFKTLYPGGTAASDSEKFDITLLMFLFMKFIFRPEKGKLTRSFENIPETDQDVVDDLTRIRCYRNKLHEIADTQLSMGKEKFDEYVQDLRTVFTRLAKSCNDLSNIEKSVEEELGADFVSLETQIKTILEEIKQDKKWAETIMAAIKTATKQNPYKDVKDILPDAVFVKTKQYEEAKKSLFDEHIIILNGSPGEGKTTVAKKLLKEVSKVRCIEVNSVNEFNSIGNDVDAVLIDDMFGASVFDKYKYRKWQNKLQLISQWVNQTGCEIERRYVVITSRTYIFEKARDHFYFQSPNLNHKICSLSSDKLEPKEKKLIIEKHFQINGKTPPDDSILDEICKMEVSSEDPASPFIIGFPECARIFSGITFNEGIEFFKAPMKKVINDISELFKDDDTFVAFFLLWTGKVRLKDIERPLNDTSDKILKPIKSLQYSPETCLRKIKGVLYNHAHKGGLISEDTSETFTFSHRVVCDAVGLIAFEKNPTAALTHCDKDFIERYISFEPKQDTEIGIRLKKSRYDQLSSRILDLVIPDRDIISDNYSLFKCSIFEKEEFCSEFLKADISKLQILLKSSVRSVEVIFKPFKFNFLENVVKEVKLVSFLLWHKGKVTIFAERCLEEMSDTNEKLKELSTALYIASAVGLYEVAEFAIKQGGKINSEMILIAFKSHKNAQKLKERGEEEKEKERVLTHLKHTSAETKDYFPDSKGCFPIHLAAIEGYLEFVEETLVKSPQDAGIPYTGKIYDPKLEKWVSLGDASLYHIAICLRDRNLLDKLIDMDVSSYRFDDKGMSPFLYAICNNRITLVKRLHEKAKKDGNEMNPDANKNTPLHLAIMNCNSKDHTTKKIFKDIALDLCKPSDVIHLQNSDKKSPLHLACERKEKDVVDKLLKIEDFYIEEKNLLHELIKKDNIGAIEWLLPHNFDNGVDDEMRTPLQLANELGKTNISKLLQRYSSKKETKSELPEPKSEAQEQHGQKHKSKSETPQPKPKKLFRE